MCLKCQKLLVLKYQYFHVFFMYIKEGVLMDESCLWYCCYFLGDVVRIEENNYANLYFVFGISVHTVIVHVGHLFLFVSID
jgi:hypothetical protein